MAQPKLDMENPEKRPLIHQMISPFMIKINRPKVTMVTGMVNKISRGFKIALKIVSTTATGIALTKLSISAPGKRRAVIQIETVKTMRRMIYDIVISYWFHPLKVQILLFRSAFYLLFVEGALLRFPGLLIHRFYLFHEQPLLVYRVRRPQ